MGKKFKELNTGDIVYRVYYAKHKKIFVEFVDEERTNCCFDTVEIRGYKDLDSFELIDRKEQEDNLFVTTDYKLAYEKFVEIYNEEPQEVSIDIAGKEIVMECHEFYNSILNIKSKKSCFNGLVDEVLKRYMLSNDKQEQASIIVSLKMFFSKYIESFYKDSKNTNADLK